MITDKGRQGLSRLELALALHGGSMAATAASAADEAGEEMLRPAVILQWFAVRFVCRLIGEPIRAFLHSVPNGLIDNTQFRHVLNEKCGTTPTILISKIRVLRRPTFMIL